MKEMIFAGAGFVVASIIPAAALSLAFPLSGEVSAQSVAGTFAVLYPFAAAAVIVFGLPPFFLLRPFRPGRWWAVLSIGFLLGVCTSIAIRLPSFPDPNDFLTFGPLGAASAFAFWLIWKRGAAVRQTRPQPLKGRQSK
jgi:hypothetical protein